MQKKILVLVCFSLLITLLSLTPVSAASPVVLNFRVTDTSETRSASSPFTLPLEGVERISFLYSDAIDHSTGQIIPAGRISFTHHQQTVSAGQALEISPDQRSQGISPEQPGAFTINIMFFPSDLPGKYEAIIEAVCQSAGGEEKRLPLLLKINVLPWIKLKSAIPNQTLIIDQVSFRGDTEIKARHPVSILVASNAPWRLYMKIDSGLTGHRKPIPIALSVLPSTAYEGLNASIYPYEDYKLVAAGPPTVVGDRSGSVGYWTELVLSAEIPNAHLYPAGQYTFILSFSAITLEP
ncbi:MAG: hypothetical protein GX050_05495 [Firmicutes bacterium]|nr:hypothetical protein [Bacillota bacterium]